MTKHHIPQVDRTTGTARSTLPDAATSESALKDLLRRIRMSAPVAI